jgi:hypothetical protein
MTPLPAPDARRASAPFAPYLVYVPDDFALSLAFSGGGDYGNGRFMFDADGNLWSGQNWVAWLAVRASTRARVAA